MKKLLALLLIFTFSVALWLLFFAKNDFKATFSPQAVNEKEVIHEPTSETPVENKEETEPASVETTEVAKIPEKSELKFKDRFIDGKMPENLDKVEFINHINPDWKSNLARNLMHFLPEDSKVSITHEKEVVRFFGENRAQYAEIVLIKTTLPSQKNSSYHALIDSSSSKVLNTWDFDRVEL